MSSKLMGLNNSKWFPMLQEGTNEGEMSFDDIVGFVKENEKVSIGGKNHKPILHSDLLMEFRNRANNVGLNLTETKVGLSRDGMKIMVVANSANDKDSEYGLSCGFRNSTNSSQAFSGIFGSHCFICSNGLVSGLIQPSRQKNTTLNYNRFGDKIDIIFDKFDSNRDNVRNQIAYMGSVKLTDDIIGKFVRALVKDGSIGNTHICNILREIDNPTLNRKDDDSCLKLLNAGTWTTTHEYRNPMQGSIASRLINNTLMKIIKDDFVPLGDVVDVEAEEEN